MHYKDWFWLRDEIASYVHRDPAGTHYTDAELRTAIKRQSWGAGPQAEPVSQVARDEAYASMFRPVCEETGPVLTIIDGRITRTAQIPTYSD